MAPVKGRRWTTCRAGPRNKAGKVTEVWLGGARLRPEKALAAVLESRFGSDKAPDKPRSRH